MALFGSISKKNGSNSGSGFPWSSVANFAGDLLAGVGPAIGAGLSYAQQNALLDKQFAFQERMSNTAHQREVRDLLAAGINPLYTATGGNGASTPMGSTGSQTDFANAFSSGIGNAMARRMQRAQVEAMDYENVLRRQNALTGIQQTRLAKKQADNYERELAARIKLMADQGTAALASGAASSANASYLTAQEGLTQYQQQLNNLDQETLKKYPWLRTLGSAFRAIGITPNVGVNYSKK